MNYEIGLSNGMSLSAEMPGFDSEKRAVAMSGENLLAVTIGEFSVSKHMVMYIAPTSEVGDVKIFLSTGKSFHAEDTEYGSSNYTEKINSGKLFAALGNAVVNRNYYMMAMPGEEK